MRKLVLLGLVMVLALGPLAVARPAEAASFTVNDASDDVDRNPGNGQCRVNLLGAARCTLRAAIMETNALAGADTIILPAGTYVLTRGGPLDGTAENGDLDIRDDLTISGAGAATTIIDANGAVTQDRVFDLLSPTGSTPEVTISGVTIRGGRSTQSGGGLGVGIGAELTLLNSIVTQNFAESGGGGLVANEETRVTIVASTLSANSTNGDGGGFRGLSADFGPGTRWNFVNSTISGNSARGDGGGVQIGAGPCCLNPDMVLPGLYSTTITDNTADSDRNNDGDGGGLAGLGAALHNTLVAGNFDRTRPILIGSIIQPDCALVVTAGSRFSLVQNPTGCTFATTVPGLVTGADPLLGPLANNGGPTPTHLIASGPAHNAGDPNGCQDHFGTTLSTDQRGLARHLAIGHVPGRCDIGATELFTELFIGP